MSNPWNFNTRILGPNPKGSALTLEELDNSLLYLSASLENNPTASYLSPLSQSVELTGSIELTGSLFVNGGTFMNVATQSIPFTVPSEYNALLVGPIFLATTMSVSGTLVII